MSRRGRRRRREAGRQAHRRAATGGVVAGLRRGGRATCHCAASALLAPWSPTLSGVAVLLSARRPGRRRALHRPAALRLPPWRYAPLARPPSSRRTTPAPPRRIFRIGREKSIVQRAPNNFGKTHGALASSPAADAAAATVKRIAFHCATSPGPHAVRRHLAAMLSLTIMRLYNITDINNIIVIVKVR